MPNLKQHCYTDPLFVAQLDSISQIQQIRQGVSKLSHLAIFNNAYNNKSIAVKCDKQNPSAFGC